MVVAAAQAWDLGSDLFAGLALDSAAGSATVGTAVAAANAAGEVKPLRERSIFWNLGRSHIQSTPVNTRVVRAWRDASLRPS